LPEAPTFSAFFRSARVRWSETVTGSRSASYVILAAIIGIVNIGLAASINEPLSVKLLIGIVPPTLFFFVAFVYAVFSVWREERKAVIALDGRLSAVLKLNFDQHSDGIVLVPTKVPEQDEHGRPVFDAGGMQVIFDSHGAYIRIRLSTLTDVVVRGCATFVTRIDKLNTSGRFDTIRMPGAHRLAPTFVDVFPRVPQTIDFLQASESDNRLVLSAGTPFVLRDAFSESTTYRMTINVIPQTGPDQVIVVEEDWRGQWNTITGREVIEPLPC